MPFEFTARDLRFADVENDLARRLRALPEPEAYDEIRTLIRLDFVVGQRLARRVLRRREYFEAIFQDRLTAADPSGLKHDLHSGKKSLGFDRMLELIRERLDTQPEAVERALYWLPRYVPDDAATEQVNALADELATRRAAEGRVPHSDPPPPHA